MTNPKPDETNNLNAPAVNAPAVKLAGPDFNETTNLKEGTWPADASTRTNPD